jgi:hypothetical protein
MKIGIGLAEWIWPSVPLDADGIREAARAFEEIGTTELFFSPTIASLEQVELLAEAALGAAERTYRSGTAGHRRDTPVSGRAFCAMPH